MVQGCGNKCVKYIFWLINFLFFVLGAVIVGLSVWLLVDKNSLTRIAQNVQIDINSLRLENFYVMLYIAIGIGAALLILGFFGCCGSCCESTCAIGIYFTLVLILFVIEIVAIVLYFVYKSKLEQGLVDIWRTELVSKYTTQPQIQKILDPIQTQFQCCGASGCSDYIPYGVFPSTCQCATVSQIGCATYIWRLLESNFIYVAIVGIIVLIIEFFAMIFSCVIISAVREKKRSQA